MGEWHRVEILLELYLSFSCPCTFGIRKQAFDSPGDSAGHTILACTHDTEVRNALLPEIRVTTNARC